MSIRSRRVRSSLPALLFCRIRLLARSAASQAAGRRSKLLCGTWPTNKSAGNHGVVDSDGRIVWFSSRSPRVRFPLTSLASRSSRGLSEVTRPDEDTVLKTAAVKTVVGSSPTASAFESTFWERFHTGGCNPSAFNCVVVGERCESLRSHFENTYTSLV